MKEISLLSRGGAAASGARENRTHHYWAFLSYSHKDSEVADWLHGALEKYRVPRALVGTQTPLGTVPAGFAPIFRDRHELAASGDLGHTIREALASSRCLIVLCSPEAAHSRWTNEEIVAFKKAHPDASVLAAIVEGEPFASEITGHEEEECFPPALRQKFDSRGRPTGKRAEPIAADLRPAGDGRHLGLLKIVAGMIGVGLDDLVQREQQRRHKRLTYIAAASLAGMTMTSGLAAFAFDSRDEARDQRKEAEGLVGFMLGDLREKLEPIGKLDALDAVGGRALEYFEKQDKSELSDEALTQRSRALTLMGEIAQKRGDLEGALARYREAMASTAEMARRYPDDPQRLFDHAQNVFWVGYVDWQRDRIEQAATAFREYKRLANSMAAIEPDNLKWRLEQTYADNNLGVVLIEQHRYREAAEVLNGSLGTTETLVASNPKDRAYQDHLLEALAWLSEAREKNGQFDDALAQRERQLSLLKRQAAERGADPALQLKMLAAHRAIGRLFAQRGDLRQGFAQFSQSAILAAELLQTEPENTEWAQRAAEVHLELGELELAAGRGESAGMHIRAGCVAADRLAAKDSSVADWHRLRIRCLEHRAQLALVRQSPDESRALSAQAVALANKEFARTKSLDARFALSGALLIRGQVLQANGDPIAARSAYQAAHQTWPQGIELMPSQLARLQMIFTGLGRRDDARKIASLLQTMGYRHPAYLRDLRTMTA